MKLMELHGQVKIILQRWKLVLMKGQTWNKCQLTSSSEKYAWVRWNYKWEALKKGEYIILSKATDSKGNVQPLEPMWNRKGYGYNALDRIKVKIE